MRLFDKRRREWKWTAANKETTTLIKEAKTKYYEDAVLKLSADGAGKILKDIAIPDRPAPLTIGQVLPDLGEGEIAEKLATYFSRITQDFTQLDNPNIETYSSLYRTLFYSPMKSPKGSDLAKNQNLRSEATSSQQ